MRLRSVGMTMPQPLTTEWDWQLQARCRSMSITVFYPEAGLRGQTLRHIEEEAKSICQLCPVIQDCRSHAEQCGEPYGIWGGLTEHERASR